MVIPLLLASLAGTAMVQQTDTVLPVAAGSRLDIDLMRGELTIRTWDRREVQVVSSTGRMEVRKTNGLVKVRADVHDDVMRHGDALRAHVVEVTVPRDMAIDAQGAFLSADLDGIGGEVRVETTNGRVRLRGGRTFIRLHTVQGQVVCEDAEGKVDLHSTNGTVSAANVTGEMQAHTVNGAVSLRDIRSASVEASTVNGAIEYFGTIEAGGRYVLETHAGDLTVAIPATAGVALTASTFSGSFDSAFPVTLEQMQGGQTLSLALGDGGAQMELTSFSGTIRLRRP